MGTRIFSSLLAGLMLHRMALAAVLVISAVALWQTLGQRAVQNTLASRLVLVVPDGTASDNVHVQAWQDAAAEVGVVLELRSASQLLRAGKPLLDVALIVPDTIHRQMNDLLVAHLQSLVLGGTKLMLVHDAGVSDLSGNYHPKQSRLSSLAGVDYALYGELAAKMASEHVVWADVDALPHLRLPPGKLMRENSNTPLVSTQAPPMPGEELAVVGYHYGRLSYPVFATRGTFDGQRLLHAKETGLVAGRRILGRGEVLFVNLPLGYLKLRTDAFFMHSFLRLFAEEMVQLPQLASMPSAIGALIMNWHIDSAAAVPAMQMLAGLKAFDQGPYSVHLTAGPDVDRPGDALGMNLANNTAMREWVRRFAQRGDEVGSHGGWIHNEFGRLVDVQDRSVSAAMISRNSEAVSGASARPVREYSAPTGNHPAWVTQWLAEHGVQAYYFTGDVGMPPTRSFQDGRRSPEGMWAFPVLSYGLLASFEEARKLGVREADITTWLTDVADYCASYRTARLVYFHPPGIALFANAFKDWMQHTAALAERGTLHWMTMAQYADFANQRAQVQWRLVQAAPALAAGPASGTNPATEVLMLEASHPKSLERMSWLLPTARYAQPVVTAGQALIDRDDRNWRVVAGSGTTLNLRLQLLPASLPTVLPKPEAKKSL